MATRAVLEVTSGGSLATVQDLGRTGYGRWGVPPGGALDPMALRTANALVGNRADEAGVEITLMGFSVRARERVCAAICGADLSAHWNDGNVELGRSFVLEPGDVLSFPRPRWGCRAYLAVGGGVGTEVVLSSRSTCLGAAFGGLSGRALARGDVLEAEDPEAHLGCVGRAVPPETHPTSPRGVRVLPGPQAAALEGPYAVSPVSSRAGIRFDGKPIPKSELSLLSEGVVPGCVQVTGNGQPLVTLVETVTGGYPVAAVVACADLGVLAQLVPGDTVVFREITEAAACDLLRRQAALLRDLVRRYPPVGD